MSVETKRMHAGLAAASVVLGVVLCSIAGCGGSGSSGFDVSPLTESQAIARAIDADECVVREAQTYCASGVETPDENFAGASVIIDEPAAPLVCDGRADPTAECVAELQFTTEGFMTPNSLLAAVAESERGPWTIVPLTITEEDLTGPRTVTISVPASAEDTPSKPLIAAVLVYAGVPPDEMPRTAHELADFGVDLVYVSERLEIVVPR
jgi:hypothetical protein